MSTSQNWRPSHSARAKWRSRVVPASSLTIALLSPMMRLKSADLPTFGRPMQRDDGNVHATLPPLASRLEHVDEVVGREDRHRQRLAHDREGVRRRGRRRRR